MTALSESGRVCADPRPIEHDQILKSLKRQAAQINAFESNESQEAKRRKALTALEGKLTPILDSWGLVNAKVSLGEFDIRLGLDRHGDDKPDALYVVLVYDFMHKSTTSPFLSIVSKRDLEGTEGGKGHLAGMIYLPHDKRPKAQRDYVPRYEIVPIGTVRGLARGKAKK